MSDICVPPTALRSLLTFKDWCDSVAYQLFYDQMIDQKFTVLYEPSKSVTVTTDQEMIELLEKVMTYVNLVFNENPALVNYKDKPTGKWDTKTTNIVAVACFIVASNYQITYATLASYVGVNYSTVIYYMKRHASHCVSKDYRNKYFKLLTLLQHEGVISTTKNERSDAKRLLSTILSGIKPESGLAALRSY
jgi:hypothetical protein